MCGGEAVLEASCRFFRAIKIVKFSLPLAMEQVLGGRAE